MVFLALLTNFVSLVNAMSWVARDLFGEFDISVERSTEIWMKKNTVEAFDNGLVDRATRREEAPQNTFVESFLKWVAFCIQSTAIRWDEAEDEENEPKTGHQCDANSAQL